MTEDQGMVYHFALRTRLSHHSLMEMILGLWKRHEIGTQLRPAEAGLRMGKQEEEVCDSQF